MAVLVSETIDPEEIIKQYNWLCSIAIEQEPDRREIVGLQNLLESLMMRMWGTTAIYQNIVEPLYLVIMPDHETTYYMQCNEYGTFFCCTEGPAEGDLNWRRVNNDGDMVPIGFPEEVSIISVEPVIRRKILQYISEDQGYYEQYLEPTT